MKVYRVYSNAFIKNGYLKSSEVKQKLKLAFPKYRNCKHFDKYFKKYFNKELKKK